MGAQGCARARPTSDVVTYACANIRTICAFARTYTHTPIYIYTVYLLNAGNGIGIPILKNLENFSKHRHAAHIYVFTLTDGRALVRTYTYTYTFICLYRYIQCQNKYIHTYIRTCVRTRVRTYVPTYMRTYVRTYTHNNAYAGALANDPA